MPPLFTRMEIQPSLEFNSIAQGQNFSDVAGALVLKNPYRSQPLILAESDPHGFQLGLYFLIDIEQTCPFGTLQPFVGTGCIKISHMFTGFGFFPWFTPHIEPGIGFAKGQVFFLIIEFTIFYSFQHSIITDTGLEPRASNHDIYSETRSNSRRYFPCTGRVIESVRVTF